MVRLKYSGSKPDPHRGVQNIDREGQCGLHKVEALFITANDRPLSIPRLRFLVERLKEEQSSFVGVAPRGDLDRLRSCKQEWELRQGSPGRFLSQSPRLAD